MSALQQLLARAEANAVSKAAEVESIARSRTLLKDAEDAAKKDHRQALGVVVRLRAAIEAVKLLPADPSGLPESGGSPPFTPALDFPDAHPVDPPAPVIVETATEEPKPKPATSPHSDTVPSPVSASARQRLITDRIMRILEEERIGRVASIEWLTLRRTARCTPTQAKRALDDLQAQGRIKAARPAEPGVKSFIICSAEAAAA